MDEHRYSSAGLTHKLFSLPATVRIYAFQFDFTYNTFNFLQP